MKQLLTIIFLFIASTLLAQTLYTRTDTLAITTDSVTLQAGAYRGAIQWQRSVDGQTWENQRLVRFCKPRLFNREFIIHTN